MVLGKSISEKRAENIEIKVIENPKPAAPALDLIQAPEEKPQPKPKEEPTRKIFGVSRKALTADEPGAGVEVKQGNTLATTPDNEKLKENDADSLPIPVDEYLVSRMPELLQDMRIPYPLEAKEKGIEGPVVVQILVDAMGVVREAKLIRGLGHGLDEAAMAALKGARFRPAESQGKPVAVSTRFTYRFVLER